MKDIVSRVGRRALQSGLDAIPNRIKWELMAYAPVPYLNIVPAETEEEFKQSGIEDVAEIIHLLNEHGKTIDPKNKNVLEIGTGPGRLLVPFAEKGANAYGVEISRKNIGKARNYAEERGVDVKLKQSGKGLPDFDTAFDLIYSNLVFQHMRRRTAIQYLIDGYNYLSDDGLVYFTFANLESEDNRETLFTEGLDKDYSFRMRYYTLKEVDLLMREVGFNDITVLDDDHQIIAIAER